MSRLPFLFIVSGMIGFFLFHMFAIVHLYTWISQGLREPTGWFHIHLFVLGWGTMLAFGAIYQLMNVILQSKIYKESLGYVHYALFTIGLFGLLYGFISGHVGALATFGTITIIGILVFGWNMAHTILRSKQWNVIIFCATSSIVFLVLAAITGLTMGLNFAIVFGNSLHSSLFGTHIWLGTVGWFGLLITGFSYKMLPMFYLAHHYPTKLQLFTTILWTVSVIIGVVHFLILQQQWSFMLAVVTLLLAIVIYNIHLLQIRKYKHKKNPGPGIRWTMIGNFTFAILAILVVTHTLIFNADLLNFITLRLVTWLYLIMWVSFMILGYASKIVPFLWWTYKYGNRVGQKNTPVMSDMLSERWAFLGLAAIMVTSLVVMVGISVNSPSIIAYAGLAYSLCCIAYISLIAYVFTK